MHNAFYLKIQNTGDVIRLSNGSTTSENGLKWLFSKTLAQNISDLEIFQRIVSFHDARGGAPI
jgi:hypothetical protein